MADVLHKAEYVYLEHLLDFQMFSIFPLYHVWILVIAIEHGTGPHEERVY